MGCKFVRALAFCSILSGTTALSLASKTIVDEPPREPADELKALHLPPGFEVQLVASEPDIHKPININFDDRGRLWITDTVEYPFPAPEGAKTRDTVKILEDFDENGKARKITTFADNLNIPIGILPRGDTGAIVYSIPAVWTLTDTQNAGLADKRTVLLSGYTHDDTHGMTGSFTEGFDGWIYAVHGFRNTSTIKGADGSTITMNSGNTYRFKPDGSRVEQFTHGQVNPFGLCFDPEGNLFTSDCETMPIALMLREAYYPSFGKPDDGLGFAPNVCDHMYGSTAIAGLVDYVADQFPAEYRNRMFVGNVVTNRINAAQLVPHGSGFHGDDSPDFVVSDDGWFRPVNIKLGPDGALWVADFYNRIIGHYEVDLHHPGRDKQRGRIWRIVYKGNGSGAPTPFDLTKQSVQQIVDDLASDNMTIRMLAMNRLADYIGKPAIEPLTAAFANPKNPAQKLHTMWDLYRLGALSPEMLKSAATDPQWIVREHAMRVLADMAKWDAAQRDLALAGLKDESAQVQRAAADSIGKHAQYENIRPLLDARENPTNDPFLTHVLRIALRDHLEIPGVGQQLASAQLTTADQGNLADSAAGATGADAAGFLLHYVQSTEVPASEMSRYVRTIVKGVPDSQAEELARFMSDKFADDIEIQLAACKSVTDALSQRGAAPGEAVRSWASDLAKKEFDEVGHGAAVWTFHPIEGSTDSRNPWGEQSRASADGNNASTFLSSNVHGETLTGVAKSPVFKIPPKLTFFLAGHNGRPPDKHPEKNFVRLRDAKTDEILKEQVPPRNDRAKKITWNLEKFAGREGYFEAVDGDDGKAYAWLAFGRFSPAVVNVGAAGPRLTTALQIVEGLHLIPLGANVEKLMASGTLDTDTRVTAARTLAGLDAPTHASALAAILRDATAPDALREAVAGTLGSVNSPDAASALVEVMHAAPQKLQLSLAKSLAATSGGADALLNAIHDGKASAHLLQDANLRERLGVAKPPNLDERVAALTKGLPAADAQIQKLIDDRAAAFDPKTADAKRGRLVFEKTCMVCHMVGGQGAHVGPQLDGIGARGVPRLCEDVLDPSRNVDAAFRYSTFVLSDGNVIAGIPRKEEGQVLTVADSTGKEVAIDKTKITRRVESQLSLMPSNFGEVIPPADFNDLMAYLLSTKQ